MDKTRLKTRRMKRYAYFNETHFAYVDARRFAFTFTKTLLPGYAELYPGDGGNFELVLSLHGFRTYEGRQEMIGLTASAVSFVHEAALGAEPVFSASRAVKIGGVTVPLALVKKQAENAEIYNGIELRIQDAKPAVLIRKTIQAVDALYCAHCHDLKRAIIERGKHQNRKEADFSPSLN